MHSDEEQLRKYMKKVKKDMHDNLGHGEKEQIRKNYWKEKVADQSKFII